MLKKITFVLAVLIGVVGTGKRVLGQTLVWSASFSGTSLPTGWAAENNVGTGWVVVAATPNQDGASHARHRWAASSNNYLFTKAISMTSGNVYDLKFYARAESAGFPESYTVKVGKLRGFMEVGKLRGKAKYTLKPRSFGNFVVFLF